MPADNRLELVVEVDTRGANASIKSVNSALGSMEQAAAKAAQGASQGIDGMTASMTKAVLAGQAIYGALLSAARALESMTLGAVHTQDMLGKTAQRIGMSVESLSALRHAAELSDISMEDLSGSMAKFAKNIAGGSAVLDVLHVQMRNADHSMRDTYSILSDVADRFSRMPDGVQKTALAIELFGRGGARMIPLLNQGAAGLAAMRKEASELGIVVTQETAKRAEEFNDNLRRLREAVQGLSFELARELVPAAIKATDAILRWVREGGLPQLVDYLRQAAEWAKNIGLFIAAAYVVPRVLELAGAMWKLRDAIVAVTLATARNPILAIGTFAATAAAYVYEQKQKIEERGKTDEQAAKKAQLFSAVQKGATLEQLRKQGFDEGSIRQAFGLPTLEPGESPKLEVSMEDVEKLLEARRKAAEAEKRASEILRKAREGEVEGLARIVVEYRQYREELGLTQKALRDLATAEQIALQTEAKKELAKAASQQVESIERQAEITREMAAKRFQAEREFQDQTLDLYVNTAKERFSYEQTVAEQIRDAELRQLEAVDAQTVQDQIAVQGQKLKIEEEYLMRRYALRADELRRESELEVAMMETIARARGISEENIAAQRDAILQAYGERARQLDADTQAAINAARENTAIKQAQIVRDQNQRIFDSLKRQAEGVFDALLTKSQSIWSAIGNAFKTAILTAIKDVISSRVAAMLMQLFTGTRVTFAGGGASGGGVLGALGGMLGVGAVPVFAQGGPIPGGAAGGWGTPPFVPGSSGGVASVGLGSALSISRWSASSLAPLGLGASLLGLTGAYRLGQSGGLGAAAGAGLGAVSGLLGFGALTSMFPALVAAGPVGWIAAAGIGAFTGLIGLFRKSAEQKAREKIKAVYGVDIREKNILTQIVEIAKQAFGGNLDMAIRSQQIRDLVELYAMSTGQSTAGLPPTVKPVSLVEQGGSLFQQNASFSLDRIGPGQPSSGGPIVINISVPGAKEFFEKETVRVVVDNPRAVQSAAIAAMKQNAGRREGAALQMSPGLVIA